MTAQTMETRGLVPRARRRRRASQLVGLAAITALAFVGGFPPTSTAAGSAAFEVFQGATEAAPVRAGMGIPLEFFFKVGGSEAQILQDPVARGAGMLFDTRITQLASLLVFGTVPAPPLAFPSPTVAEAIWTTGSPSSPQTADASLVPAGSAEKDPISGSSAPVSARAGRATAEAAEGPYGAGHAAYADLLLSPPGLENAVRIRETASDSVAAVTAEGVETSSTSVARGVSLLGGMVTIDSIRSTARAVSNARPGQAVAQGSFEMGRVAALGKEAEITPDGIRIVDTSLPLPLRDAFNRQLQDNLTAAGVTIRMIPPAQVVKPDGSFASLQSAGIYVRMAAGAARPVTPVIGDMSFNMTFGFASADVSAVESSAPEEPVVVDPGDASGLVPLPSASSAATDRAGTSAPDKDGSFLPVVRDTSDLGGRPASGGPPSDGVRADEPSGGGPGPIGTDQSPPNGGADTGLATGGFAPSGLAASRGVAGTSNWWALAFVILLAGFAAVVGLQALPRLVRPGPPR